MQGGKTCKKVERLKMQTELIEKRLLSTALNGEMNGQTKQITPELFANSLHKRIAKVIQEQCQHSNPFDIVTIGSMLSDDDVVELTDICEVSPTVYIEDDILALKNAQIRRKYLLGLQSVLHDSQKPEADAEAIYERIRALAEVRPARKQSAYDDGVFLPAWNNQPEQTEALMELNHTRILSAGNLSMVTAGAGMGKSSIFEAACASVGLFEGEFLGLRINAPKVCYIDTERSHADHHGSWRRFMKRRGLAHGDLPPENVRWFNVRGMDTIKERVEWLFIGMERVSEKTVFLIDGVGDFISDVNDSEEVVSFVSRLSALAHNRELGIFLSLHNNPSTNNTKARGVLGSELWRKCECTLIIEKMENGVRKLTTDYNLGKNRSGDDTISSFFTWGQEEKMHVSCDPPEAPTTTGRTEKQRKSIVDGMKQTGYTYTELKNIVMEKLGVSEKTAKTRIAELVNMKKIEKIGTLYQKVNRND